MSTNLQELFDRIVNHLAVQKIQAVDDFMCQYRTPIGLSCAVGCLIPDEKYKPEFDEDKYDVKDIAVKTKILDGLNDLEFDEAVKFLEQMQSEHDEYIETTDPVANALDLRKRLGVVAEEYLLDYSCVDLIKTWSRHTNDI
jgi:hypothetical protein